MGYWTLYIGGPPSSTTLPVQERGLAVQRVSAKGHVAYMGVYRVHLPGRTSTPVEAPRHHLGHEWVMKGIIGCMCHKHCYGISKYLCN